MIYPTGTCFDDALDFLERVAKVGAPKKQLEEFTVVHGICMTPTEPSEPFAHAWVEHGPTEAVWQLGIIGGRKTAYAMPIERFQEVYKPLKTTRYTVVEAVQLNWLTNHYGPWEPEYEALCKPDGERRVLGSAQVDVMLLARKG